MKTKIRWEGASYQSSKSAAVADVQAPDGRTYRLSVKRTAPRERTFRGSINGAGVGTWGTVEQAKEGVIAIFESSVSYAKNRRTAKGDRRVNGRVAATLMRESADKLEERAALLKQIQAALGTEETGAGLVKAVRDARAAELALAALRSGSDDADATPEEDEAFEVLARRTDAARSVS